MQDEDKSKDELIRELRALRQQIAQRDKVESQQMEVALRESEQRLLLALDAAQMGFWDWNIPANQITWSQNHERLFGLEPGTFNKTYEAFLNQVHSEDSLSVQQVLTEALSNKTHYKDEFRIIWPDQSVHWISAQGRFFYNEAGQAVRMIGVCLDISARKHREQALQESEASLQYQSKVTQTITDNATSCLFMMDTQGRCTFVNPAGEKMTGYSFAELKGKVLHDMIHHTHPDGRPYPMEECPIDRALPQNNQIKAHEDIFVRKDGTFFFVLCAASPIIKNGVPVGTVIEVRDITEEKRVEAERTQLLAREKAAREEAEEANRIKDEFLAVLSHELRTPLNPILGWSQLLRTRKFSPEKTAQALETIERNAKLQAQLVEDLLDVSRILQGKLSLNPSLVDLAVITEAAIETIYTAAEAKSIQIEIILPASQEKVWGDASRLQQIIWNLLSNAVKFTPSRGKVQIRLEYLGKDAQIEVVDTGQGISADFLPYIFDYFRQADSTTTRNFGGLGLGLAIVRKLVELHGGTVQAYSAGIGQGATFTLTFPIMRAEDPSGENHDRELELSSLDGLKVLVVDDEVDSLELITFILEQYGIRVTAASSAQEALLLFEQVQPNLLISDIGMPEMDGYMLIQKIRALPAAQGGKTPAIALTAYAGDTNQKQIIAAGFHCHVTKPVALPELMSAIAQLVQPILVT